MISAVNHITINIRNVQDSARFYGELLGLPKLEEVDRGDHHIYYYGLPGGVRLELVEYRFETESSALPSNAAGSFRHFAMEVNDVKQVCQTLKQAGVPILEGPCISEELGFEYILVKEPNGCELEFVQRLS